MATIKDIAKHLNLSTTTISHVLNGRDKEFGIKDATRQRVLRAVKDFGYRRNAAACEIVTGKTRVIGFLATGLNAEYVAECLAGAVSEANRRNLFIKIFSWGGREDKQTFEDALKGCLEYRPLGILCRGISPEQLDYLHNQTKKDDIPIVNLDSSAYTHPCIPVVRSDDKMGCRLAVDHLSKLGHKRIALISGSEGKRFSDLRKEGFIEELKKSKRCIPAEYCYSGPQDNIKGFIETVMNRGCKSPTAFFCVNDSMALLTIRYLSQLGIRVPEDVSIVGFGDQEMAKYSNPPLTTIHQPQWDIGRKALSMALDNKEDILESKTFMAQEFLLKVKLIERESTTKAKAE